MFCGISLQNVDSNSSGEIKQSGGISSSAILISPMDFVHVISEVPVWKNAKATNKVFVNDPEKYFAYMTEIEPVNPRHLVDIIHKFQPLLSWTKNSVFAKVLLAFQYDNKYYVLYEFFEEENRKVALDEAKEFYKNAVEALYEIHKQGLFHAILFVLIFSWFCIKFSYFLLFHVLACEVK